MMRRSRLLVGKDGKNINNVTVEFPTNLKDDLKADYFVLSHLADGRSGNPYSLSKLRLCHLEINELFPKRTIR